MELPEEIELLPGIVRDLLDQGDLVRADVLLKKALDHDLDPRLAAELRSMRRKIRKEQFFKTCPVALDVSTSDEIYIVGSEIETRFLIRNLSPWILKIPARDWWSWLPWAETRDSCILAHFVITDVNHENQTIASIKWDEVIPFPSTLIVEPDRVEHLAVELKPAHAEGLLYRRVMVDAELVPGGLELGGQDFGLLRLPFQKRVVHLFHDKEERDSGPFRFDIPEGVWRKQDVLRLFKKAVLLEGEEKWRCVDFIVGRLPSLPHQGQKLMMIALSLMTGRRPEINVNLWMDWWAAERPGRIPEPGPDQSGSSASPVSCSQRPGAVSPSSLALSAVAGSLTPSKTMQRALWFDSADGGGGGRCDIWRREMGDAFHGRRYRAVKRIAAHGGAALQDLEKLFTDPDPLVRKGCVEVLEGIGGPESVRLLATWSTGEKHHAVQLALAHALAGMGEDLPAQVEPAEQRIVVRFYENFRLLEAMEEVMHEGTVPGFYDGQFARFWDVSPSIVDRLKEIATDDDFHFIVRVLAVMALSEKKLPTMESDLGDLLIPPRSELNREWIVYQRIRLIQDSSEEVILEDRDLNLSAYARYSLGKAGYPDAVQAKIHEMKDWLKRHAATVDENRIFKGLIGRRLILEQEFSRDLYFDIGYEYQQLDDFGKAEEWYLKLIDRFPESLSVPGAHYNLACLYSVTSRAERAIYHLAASMEKGFFDFSWMEKDRDLDNIRSLPAFKELKKEVLSSESSLDQDQ